MAGEFFHIAILKIYYWFYLIHIIYEQKKNEWWKSETLPCIAHSYWTPPPRYNHKFSENGRDSAKTVVNGIAQHEILYHFSFDTIGEKPFFNFFFEKNRKSPHE